MFLLKRFVQVVWTLSLESVLVGASNLKCNVCEGSFFIFSLWCRSFPSLFSSNDSRPAVHGGGLHTTCDNSQSSVLGFD